MSLAVYDCNAKFICYLVATPLKDLRLTRDKQAAASSSVKTNSFTTSIQQRHRTNYTPHPSDNVFRRCQISWLGRFARERRPHTPSKAQYSGASSRHPVTATQIPAPTLTTELIHGRRPLPQL